jgi:hypothetical protein
MTKKKDKTFNESLNLNRLVGGFISIIVGVAVLKEITKSLGSIFDEEKIDIKDPNLPKILAEKLGSLKS